MLLKSITLQNFRCFGPDLTVIEFDRFTTLIGANSAGKTAVMHALRKLFSPIQFERAIDRSDFHVPKGTKVAESTLVIEVRFDFPELTASTDPQAAKRTVPTYFRHLTSFKNGDVPHVRMRLVAQLNEGVGPEGEVEQSFKFLSADDNSDGPNVSATERRQIQLVYVPALRDPMTQLKYNSGTLKWRLMRAIAWTDGIKQKVASAAESASKTFKDEIGFQTILSALGDAWSEFHDDPRYSEIDFKIVEQDVDTIAGKADLIFRPSPQGLSREATGIGDGLRSLAYFSLVCALLKIELDMASDSSRVQLGLSSDAPIPALTIVAVEEPENHLAPHLLGRALKKFNKTSCQPNAQFILSSHTAGILKRIDPQSIRHLRIDGYDRTVVTRIPLPSEADDNREAYKFVKEAVRAYPEMYFAKLVVIGEGESEEIVLSRVLEVCHQPVDMAQVSIVPIGGRHVSHLWRLLNALRIPYITLLDLDRGRGGAGWGWGRVRYAAKELHKLDVSNGVAKAKKASIRICVDGDNVTVTKEQLDRYSREKSFVEPDVLDLCVAELRHRDVFFSYPLDLDFMMLRSFPVQYKSSFFTGKGPQIPNKDTDPKEYRKALDEAERSVLKAKDKNVQSSYSDEDRELFIYYDYYFLGRGKPVTHMIVLNVVTEDELHRDLPEPLVAMVDRVRMLLKRG